MKDGLPLSTPSGKANWWILEQMTGMPEGRTNSEIQKFKTPEDISTRWLLSEPHYFGFILMQKGKTANITRTHFRVMEQRDSLDQKTFLFKLWISSSWWHQNTQCFVMFFCCRATQKGMNCFFSVIKIKTFSTQQVTFICESETSEI